MITQAQMHSLGTSLEKLARKQNHVSPSILIEQIRGLGSKYQSELGKFNINENDLPYHAGLFMTNKIIKNVIDIVSVVDVNKPEQVYLAFLLADFYSIFSCQIVDIGQNQRKNSFAGKDFEMLGYNSASDKRLKELYQLAKMDVNDFKNIKLDKNQIAYLKAAIVKINLMFV